MNLTCRHCDFDFAAPIDKFPLYYPDCIWCPQCQMLTAVKIAARIYSRKHESSCEPVVDFNENSDDKD